MSYYTEQKKMFIELDKVLQSGTQINIHNLILQMTLKYAVSEKCVLKRLDRYYRSGLIDYQKDVVQWQ